MRPVLLTTAIVTFASIVSAIGCESAKPQVIATAVVATARLETPRVATAPALAHITSPTPTPTLAPSPTASRATPSTALPDEFEPDNRLEQAKPMVIGGGAMLHTLAPSGDKDWIVFDTVEGIEYLIETFDVSPDISTDIVLVDQFEHIIARGQPVGNASRLTWMPDYGDPYYLLISERATSLAPTDWGIKETALQTTDSVRSYRVRITPNNNLVVVATNNTKGELALIDVRPPSTVKTIDLPQFAKSLEITPNGEYAVITMDAINKVGIVKLRGPGAPDLFTTDGVGAEELLALAPDSRFAIVFNPSNIRFIVVDLTPKFKTPGFGATCAISLRQAPKSVVVTTETPQSKYALITTLDPTGELVIIQIPANFVCPFPAPIKIDLPSTIKSLKITSDNRFAVIVTNATEREVTIIDLSTAPRFVQWDVKLGWTVQ